MIDFSKVYNAISNIGGNTKGKGVSGNTKLYDELVQEGKRLMQEAFATSNFNPNRTQNLADSYGSCLYVDGKEYPNSRRYLTPSGLATEPKKWYGRNIEGREAVDDFFDSFSAKRGMIQLVVVAAMPYGAIVEIKHKYRVIAGISGGMQELARRYNGTVRDINPYQ